MKTYGYRLAYWITAVLLLTAVLIPVPADASAGTLPDGEYSAAVTLEGGSGRASIASPAALIVQDGAAFVRIEWSSSSFDYMLVGGNKYLPAATEPHSIFEIPVLAFDEPFPITADTTAMSTPHEVDYTLTVSKPQSGSPVPAAVICAGVGVILAGILTAIKKGRK